MIEPKKDSQGNELKNGDILLSSNTPCPVEYILEGDQVSLHENEITGIYSFNFFKEIRPRFVKK